ncbi:hypothetical protein [Actinopolymorpha singaporensis]|uniref:UDP-N-acetylmuramyl pentapeptide phosphotransferase/UDP-N-acetylglucosamine-1-phosphate transferase n=1 Tax=Actinopolymorpha singaporensis TaxID=117157 RepID=A0A1H1W390_9ACTN|nr:hypothetical protein [Actinopolymorpha singaporensis]SDS91131.1 hypothetical protein SAMN04489717_4315 [Actinopolymorpha singaporensis]
MTCSPAEPPRAGRWTLRAPWRILRTPAPTPEPTGRLVVAAGAALAARQVFRRVRAHTGAGRWSRTNHRGEQVSLLLGPAAVAGTFAATMAMPGLTPAERLAAVTAVVGSGVVGAYDDLAGTADAKGLRGHVGAMRRGEVTSGAVKVAGIGATGLLAAALLARSERPGQPGGRGPGGPGRSRPGVATILADGALVAAAANLVNLLDLRPGRALKVVLAQAPLLLTSAGPALAAPVGVAAGLLVEDLGENGMLGDCGANALGAGLGVAMVARLPRPARLVVLAGLVGLILASERVSFTAVIERHAPLRRLDELGRRPPRR